MNQLVTVGAGGMLAAAILKLTFEFLRVRYAAPDTGDLGRALEKISDSLEKQTQLLQEIKGYHQANGRGLQNLSDELRELRQYFVKSSLKP